MTTTRHSKIYTSLWYTKDAEGAAKFYASVFPDSRVDRVMHMPNDSPSGPAGSVVLVDFTVLGQRFQAMTAGPHHDFNDAISIVVECEDQAEVDRYWGALMEGGGKSMPCGWVIDRWGLRWQVVPTVLDKLLNDSDKTRAKRVGDAMIKMTKFDIAALQQAHRG
jgi:predicted 3-demethylubiquinone-9 3-methyltransferase (glyoxalase superfamily)